ncbi:MAG: PilZ domain-containing protein [Gemmataceae bacterium]
MFEIARAWLHRLTNRPALPIRGERRAWPRRPAERKTMIVSGGSLSGSLAAEVLDASCAGVRLLAGQPLELGTVYRVELPPRTGTAAATVLATVIHVAPRGDGTWSVGCRFATELCNGDLRALGVEQTESRQHPPADDPGQCQARIRPTDESGPLPPTPIHNISPVGVAVRLDRRTEPGTLVTVELLGPAGGTVSILGSAVYVAETDPGHWLTVCNFVRPLDDAELRVLG